MNTQTQNQSAPNGSARSDSHAFRHSSNGVSQSTSDISGRSVKEQTETYRNPYDDTEDVLDYGKEQVPMSQTDYRTRAPERLQIRGAPLAGRLDLGMEQRSGPHLLDKIFERIERIKGPGISWMAECFYKATRTPPVTKQSLTELDIGAIISNPKLRHDVNFDRELHFRPNLDGAKGRTKMRTAGEYWDALIAELELYNYFAICARSPDYDEQAWIPYIRASQVRMPLMFETIRDILKNLVPERKQARVDEHLDVSMLMQEIEKGVCDLVSISRWLAQVLKAHCAPMRDAWVDKMVEQTEIGVETCSATSIVYGLRELLGILEAMKLDVANHQIRHLRALLIEDTINFEQKYHRSRIESGRMNVARSQQWFLREQMFNQGTLIAATSQNEGRIQLEGLIRGLLRLLLSSPREPFPETFHLDLDRLRLIRAELHDMVHFEICLEIFSSIAERLRCGSISIGTRQALRDALYAITGYHGSRESSQRWASAIGNIAVELVRQALQLAGSPHVYDSVLAQNVEEELQHAFFQAYPAAFDRHAASLEASLLPRIVEGSIAHINSSPIDIFSALVAPAGSHPPPPPPPLHYGGSDTTPVTHQVQPRVDATTDLTRRITHIAVLHWRIWGPLVYMNRDPKTEWSSQEPTPCATPQPTQIIHAPTPPPPPAMHDIGEQPTDDASVVQKTDSNSSISFSPESETGQCPGTQNSSESTSLTYRNRPR